MITFPGEACGGLSPIATGAPGNFQKSWQAEICWQLLCLERLVEMGKCFFWVWGKKVNGTSGKAVKNLFYCWCLLCLWLQYMLQFIMMHLRLSKLHSYTIIKQRSLHWGWLLGSMNTEMQTCLSVHLFSQWSLFLINWKKITYIKVQLSCKSSFCSGITVVVKETCSER